MIHPLTRVKLVSKEIGDGVFATGAIPKGTIVWTQDKLDQVFSESCAERLDAPHRALLERFAHVDAQGRYVLCWDAGKIINHACEPTLRGIGQWFQVARRDIAEGEELTCDYAECNITEPLDCTCGSPRCRGRIRAADLNRFAEAWDDEARGLLGAVRSVPQPLWPYLLDPVEAEALVWERCPLPSFRQLFAFAPG